MSKALRRTQSAKTRPRQVWNSLRKLEASVRRTDAQVGLLMTSLHDLRQMIFFELRKEITRKLCNSVNGDILAALLESGARDNGESACPQNAQSELISSVFDTLEEVLNLAPCRKAGERFSILKSSAKNYTFDIPPESLDDENVLELAVEVLRCGWKVDGHLVVKPIVFEVEGVSLLESGGDAKHGARM